VIILGVVGWSAYMLWGQFRRGDLR
jgi:hypothetical protein